MNVETNQAIAKEIADQIGHRAFVMMGTRLKMSDGPALLFDIKGSPSWNKIKVRLTMMDLYDVTFYKIGRAPTFKVTIKEIVGVGADQLKRIIENNTGLYLSL